MVAALLLFAAAWIAGLAFLVVQVRRAPHGYEDDAGFHYLRRRSGMHDGERRAAGWLRLKSSRTNRGAA